MKYDWKFKLECVEEYLKGRWIEKPEYAKCTEKSFKDKIIIWAKIYKKYGVDGLKHKTISTEWTSEKRFELVARVLAGESIGSVAIDVGMEGSLLSQWVRKYKLYGFDGLKLKKGRKPKEPDMSKEDKSKNLTKSEKEELILLRRRNEYLEAENAYLKKLRALIVQKQAESSVKAKKQPLSEDSETKDID